jgi:flagellar biosynthesis/type III secretory pathway M-ring protein FliF/YscJ
MELEMVQQNVVPGIESTLAQYGIVGVILVVAGVVIRALYYQLSKSYEERLRQMAAERDYERKRAEELVIELKSANQTMQDKTLAVLGQATAAVAEVVRTVKELHR